MAKETTPSFVLELELMVNPHERKVLNKKLNIGRQIYNACLGQALKRLRAVLSDKSYKSLLDKSTSVHQGIYCPWDKEKAHLTVSRSLFEKCIMFFVFLRRTAFQEPHDFNHWE